MAVAVQIQPALALEFRQPGHTRRRCNIEGQAPVSAKASFTVAQGSNGKLEDLRKTLKDLLARIG